MLALESAVQADVDRCTLYNPTVQPRRPSPRFRCNLNASCAVTVHAFHLAHSPGRPRSSCHPQNTGWWHWRVAASHPRGKSHHLKRSNLSHRWCPRGPTPRMMGVGSNTEMGSEEPVHMLPSTAQDHVRGAPQPSQSIPFDRSTSWVRW